MVINMKIILAIYFFLTSFLVPCFAASFDREDVIAVVLDVAANTSFESSIYSVENCKIQFNPKWYETNGNCFWKTKQWQKALASRISNFAKAEVVPANEPNPYLDAVLSIEYKTEGGSKEFPHFHYFNLIVFNFSVGEPVIVDSTYLQFLNDSDHLGLSPIFVGTQNELISLIKKYRLHIIAAYNQYPLLESEVERFVKNHWPISDMTKNTNRHF